MVEDQLVQPGIGPVHASEVNERRREQEQRHRGQGAHPGKTASEIAPCQQHGGDHGQGAEPIVDGGDPRFRRGDPVSEGIGDMDE